MVAELIDHIEVYHAEKQDGVTNQRVVIYYNCIGAFDVPDRRKIPGSVKYFSQKSLRGLARTKSASNGGVLRGDLQMIHVHVLLVAPLSTSYMTQSGTD